MAIGKKIGAFETHSTSITIIPRDGHMPSSEMNIEGVATGDVSGQLYGTMRFKSDDGKSGTYTFTSVLVSEDGQITSVAGSGTFTSEAMGIWHVAGVSDVRNRQSVAISGLIDLKNHTFNGEVFDRD